jgi:hypothetical protein
MFTRANILCIQRESSLRRLREHTQMLNAKVDTIEAVLGSDDVQTLVRRQALLLAQVDPFNAVSA